MSANHPYPKHVIEAVAKALMKSSETRDAFGAGGDWDAAGHTIKQEFLDHANTALQTLWDTDDPHKLSAGEAREIWRLIIQVRGGDTESMYDLRRILAAHAPDWGNK